MITQREQIEDTFNNPRTGLWGGSRMAKKLKDIPEKEVRRVVSNIPADQIHHRVTKPELKNHIHQ